MIRRTYLLGCLAMLTLGVVSSPYATCRPPADKEREAKLIAVLKSDAQLKDKADACRELSIIGTKACIAPLAALLRDEKLSHLARYGLEPIPDPAVDEALRAALSELKGRPLVGVIGSLGVRRDKKAVGGARRVAQGFGSRRRQGRSPPSAGSATSLPRKHWKKPWKRQHPPPGSPFRKACSAVLIISWHTGRPKKHARSARSSIAPTRLRRSVPPPFEKPASLVKKLRRPVSEHGSFDIHEW